MAFVTVDSLVKEFRRPKRQEGFLKRLLNREYTVTRAVDDVSFSVHEGELLALLGGNGAGKSTIMKALTGVLTPTSGMVEVAGLTPWRHRRAYVPRIGAVFGQRSALWWDLPLIDSFKIIKRLYEIPTEVYADNLARLVELLDMDSFLRTPVRSLSLGQRMRGEFAAALIHEPSILFLDEPTVGLDIVAKRQIRAFVAEINRTKKVTVILTSHDIDDIENLAERVVLLDEGVVAYDGDLHELKTRYAPHRILTVRLADESAVTLRRAEVGVRQDGPVVEVRFDPTTVATSDLIDEINRHYKIADITITDTELEDVLARFYSRADG
ncbi:ATP-binding cassette domain-containing protein [Nonomuraea sp. NPDC049655]|uniref:ATP-binding cassette domain-containing protein n=1 Tax=Nonomuraea sp. NPDC049655 TaxID=3364355 RepID=UPI0037AD1E1E